MRYIFLAIGLGVLIGYKGWIRERGIRWNSRLQTVWLLLLIFCMGVSIGRNGEVVRSLPLLGGIAVVDSLSTLVLEKEGKK